MSSLEIPEVGISEPYREGIFFHWFNPAFSCLQSLTGHTTAVESVRINTNEELIVAGSQSGSIRIWDLEAAKSRWKGSFVIPIFFQLHCSCPCFVNSRGAFPLHLQKYIVVGITQVIHERFKCTPLSLIEQLALFGPFLLLSYFPPFCS